MHSPSAGNSDAAPGAGARGPAEPARMPERGHEQTPEPPAESAPGVRPFSATALLGAILLLFVVTPIVDRGRFGDAVEGAALSAVLLCGLLAVGGRVKSLVAAALLVIPAVLAKWFELLWPDVGIPVFLVPALSLACTTFVAIQLLRFVMRSPVVTHETVSAAISAYLVLGLAWGFAYLLVGRADPSAFAIASESGAQAPLDPFSAYYFSFVTLLTIGYGDIAPVSKVARMLAVCEGIAGTLFIVTILGRIVAMYRPQDRPAGRSASKHSKPDPR